MSEAECIRWPCSSGSDTLPFHRPWRGPSLQQKLDCPVCEASLPKIRGNILYTIRDQGRVVNDGRCHTFFRLARLLILAVASPYLGLNKTSFLLSVLTSSNSQIIIF